MGRRKDGSCFPMEMETSQMQIGERTFTIACVRDISERKAYTEALGHQALHDALTGLPNRTLFGDRMDQAIASADRAGEPRGVLMMDLDGFKQVNDTLGHDHGDTLLREVGKRLVAALRETDTVARLGGDEFGILLDGATDLAAAATAAWKIQQACEPEFVIDDEVVHVSASIGIALFPEHGRTTADLLRRADLAMYDAKRSGSSHAVFDAAQEQQMAHQLALLADLRECVARDELVVHYQPQDRPRDPQDHRRRGAGPLAPPHAGSAAARQLPARGGAHRPDRAADEMGAQRGSAPAADLARRGRRPHDGRQHLRPQPARRPATSPTPWPS